MLRLGIQLSLLPQLTGQRKAVAFDKVDPPAACLVAGQTCPSSSAPPRQLQTQQSPQRQVQHLKPIRYYQRQPAANRASAPWNTMWKQFDNETSPSSIRARCTSAFRLAQINRPPAHARQQSIEGSREAPHEAGKTIPVTGTVHAGVAQDQYLELTREGEVKRWHQAIASITARQGAASAA